MELNVRSKREKESECSRFWYIRFFVTVLQITLDTLETFCTYQTAVNKKQN